MNSILKKLQEIKKMPLKKVIFNFHPYTIAPKWKKIIFKNKKKHFIEKRYKKIQPCT